MADNSSKSLNAAGGPAEQDSGAFTSLDDSVLSYLLRYLGRRGLERVRQVSRRFKACVDRGTTLMCIPVCLDPAIQSNRGLTSSYQQLARTLPFLDSIACSGALPPDFLLQLAGQLRNLHLNQPTATWLEQHGSVLGQLSQLQELSIGSPHSPCHLSLESLNSHLLASITTLTDLTHLSIIAIKTYPAHNEAHILEFASNLPGLESLCLQYHDKYSSSTRLLSLPTSLTRLTSLTLQGKQCVRSLEGLQNLSCLRNLSLTVHSSVTSLEPLQHLPHLEHFALLRKNPCSSHFLLDLSYLSDLTRLTALSIWELSHQGLEQLLAPEGFLCHSLQLLHGLELPVAPALMAAIQGCSALRDLGLRGVQVSEKLSVMDKCYQKIPDLPASLLPAGLTRLELRGIVQLDLPAVAATAGEDDRVDGGWSADEAEDEDGDGGDDARAVPATSSSSDNSSSSYVRPGIQELVLRGWSTVASQESLRSGDSLFSAIDRRFPGIRKLGLLHPSSCLTESFYPLARLQSLQDLTLSFGTSMSQRPTDYMPLRHISHLTQLTLAYPCGLSRHHGGFFVTAMAACPPCLTRLRLWHPGMLGLEDRAEMAAKRPGLQLLV